MVVDDDAATLALLQRQLQDAGYEVETYVDGRAALQATRQMGNGIVIADWSMPVMDGLELCRAVRELQGLQAPGGVHFILLSAHDDKNRLAAGLAAGANDYVTKPCHFGELLARIRVGQRMLQLQDELIHRNVEVQKANAQMAVLANKLEHRANTDILIGLPNRRCLSSASPKRGSRPVSSNCHSAVCCWMWIASSASTMPAGMRRAITCSGKWPK
jgi:DNA-binding response OmpR family regulator